MSLFCYNRPMIKAILFDLDGTLVDTLADIAGMMNGLLADRGLPVYPVDDYRYLVGRGFHALVQKAMPEDCELDPAAFEAEAFARYKAMGSGKSKPYPGVAESLRSLAARGVSMSVLSNKPDPMTRAMVAELFPDIAFTRVQGGSPDKPLKPDPTVALELAAAMGADPKHCAFVGDSDVDMRTARAAGMLAIGALWGFREADELSAAGADVLIGSMLELPPLLVNPVRR